MKKVIYVFLWFCLYLQGCEQKVEYQYDDVNRIYFQYEVSAEEWGLLTLAS